MLMRQMLVHAGADGLHLCIVFIVHVIQPSHCMLCLHVALRLLCLQFAVAFVLLLLMDLPMVEDGIAGIMMAWPFIPSMVLLRVMSASPDTTAAPDVHRHCLPPLRLLPS